MHTAQVKLNGFDWDSDRPVQGIVRDEAREELKTHIIHSALEWIAAFNVVAAGAWLCKWWYYGGGFRCMSIAFHKWAPELMRLITQGQM
jgi:hypothetical protein